MQSIFGSLGSEMQQLTVQLPQSTVPVSMKLWNTFVTCTGLGFSLTVAFGMHAHAERTDSPAGLMYMMKTHCCMRTDADKRNSKVSPVFLWS